jgi:uncharacterized protein (TIGR00369 family)
MLDPKTHLLTDQRWSGRLIQLSPQSAVVELDLRTEMAVDGTGLVHGGFVFSAADFAAMLAVNEPNVVLATAEVRFLRPSASGDVLQFVAKVETIEGRKQSVDVEATDSQGATVFKGNFKCVVLTRPALEAHTDQPQSSALERRNSNENQRQ